MNLKAIIERVRIEQMYKRLLNKILNGDDKNENDIN